MSRIFYIFSGMKRDFSQKKRKKHSIKIKTNKKVFIKIRKMLKINLRSKIISIQGEYMSSINISNHLTFLKTVYDTIQPKEGEVKTKKGSLNLQDVAKAIKQDPTSSTLSSLIKKNSTQGTIAKQIYQSFTAIRNNKTKQLSEDEKKHLNTAAKLIRGWKDFKRLSGKEQKEIRDLARKEMTTREKISESWKRFGEWISRSLKKHRLNPDKIKEAGSKANNLLLWRLEYNAAIKSKTPEKIKEAFDKFNSLTKPEENPKTQYEKNYRALHGKVSKKLTDLSSKYPLPTTIEKPSTKQKTPTTDKPQTTKKPEPQKPISPAIQQPPPIPTQKYPSPLTPKQLASFVKEFRPLAKKGTRRPTRVPGQQIQTIVQNKNPLDLAKAASILFSNLNQRIPLKRQSAKTTAVNNLISELKTMWGPDFTKEEFTRLPKQLQDSIKTTLRPYLVNDNLVSASAWVKANPYTPPPPPSTKEAIRFLNQPRLTNQEVKDKLDQIDNVNDLVSITTNLYRSLKTNKGKYTPAIGKPLNRCIDYLNVKWGVKLDKPAFKQLLIHDKQNILDQFKDFRQNGTFKRPKNYYNEIHQ